MRLISKRAGLRALLATSALTVKATAASAQQTAAYPTVAVRTYASQPALVDSVNTHWIETPSGLIVIDAQRILAEAEAAVRHVQAAGKPVLGIFITHPHTDHYGGLSVFRRAFPNAPVFASAETVRSMREDSKGYNDARRRRHGEMFPTQAVIDATLPNRIVKDGDVVELGGARIEIWELRENEAEVMTMLHLPEQRALFVGDLVNDGFVPVPFENADNWLAQLDEIERRFPDVAMVYMGHGVPGSARERIAAQRRYLVDLRDAVRGATTDKLFSADEADRVVFELEGKYPHWHGVGGQPRRDVLRFVAGLVAQQQGARVETEARFR